MEMRKYISPTRSSTWKASTSPRIDRGDTRWREVGDIARYDLHTVDEGGRSDERVAIGTRVRNVEASAASCDCRVDRDDATRERRQHLILEPSPKHRALVRISPLDEQHPHF
jgi:hypothetical protein